MSTKSKPTEALPLGHVVEKHNQQCKLMMELGFRLDVCEHDNRTRMESSDCYVMLEYMAFEPEPAWEITIFTPNGGGISCQVPVNQFERHGD